MRERAMSKTEVHKTHISFMSMCFCAVGILALCSGCTSERGELFAPLAEPLVWPGAPEEPRIKFVGVISTEEDLKKEVPWSEGLLRFFFGREETGVMLGPYDMCVDDRQRLFVADMAGANIHIFGLDDRKYHQFSEMAGGETLAGPISIELVGDRLYVADSVLRKICVFDLEGNFIFSFGEDALERPSSIAYQAEGKRIYVSDTAGHTIKIFTKDGKLTGSIGSRGSLPGQFNYPTHLWIDESGKIYISDTLNYRVQIFSKEGVFVKFFGSQGDRPGNFAHPSGISTDNYGNIYVVDRQYENVQIFDPNGRVLMALGQEGSGFGEFWLPGGIFIDDTNRIFIADSFNKRVQIFELIDGGTP